VRCALVCAGGADAATAPSHRTTATLHSSRSTGNVDAPTALVTRITGQDGGYLGELLLEKEHNVFGVARRVSKLNNGR